MAIDKGYGSGKSRSAADSRFRQRATAGQMTKGKKGVVATIKSQRAKQAASPVGQLADFAMGFLLPGGPAKKFSGNPLYKAMNTAKPVRPTVDSIKGLYPGKGFSEPTLAQKKIFGSVNFKSKPLPKSIKSLNSYNSSQSTNYSLPLGLGIIGGAAVVGANAAKDNARKAAIKKASTKTRKGQTRGR